MGGSMDGRWELPGGKVEAGEDCVHALEREYLEEFSLTIRCGAFLTETYFMHKGRVHRVSAFEVGLAQFPAKLTVHDRLQWFSPDEICTILEDQPRFLVDSDAKLLSEILGISRLWS